MPVYGSFLVPTPGATTDARIGSVTTPSYALPPPSPDTDLATLVSGRTGDGNALRVEYGRSTPQGVDPLDSIDLSDEADSSAWRGIALIGEDGPPPGADAVRLLATDAGTATGGWPSPRRACSAGPRCSSTCPRTGPSGWRGS